MSKRNRRKAKVRREREGGCPTCGNLVHVLPRRGRLRSVMPRYEMRPMGRRGWRMPVDLPRGTPRPSIRLSRWERHQPAQGERWWFGHCPDPWHQRNLLGSLDRRGEPKRRR